MEDLFLKSPNPLFQRGRWMLMQRACTASPFRQAVSTALQQSVTCD